MQKVLFMSFRKFTEYGAASRNNITIRTNGLLFISKNVAKQVGFYQKKPIGGGFYKEFKYSVLFIDEENKKVGIKFYEEKPDGEYRKISDEKAGISLNIFPVLRFFGINKLDKKFTTDFEINEDMLVFSIKDLIK